jgi:hypothetical protein
MLLRNVHRVIDKITSHRPLERIGVAEKRLISTPFSTGTVPGVILKAFNCPTFLPLHCGKELSKETNRVSVARKAMKASVDSFVRIFLLSRDIESGGIVSSRPVPMSCIGFARAIIRIRVD